MKNKEFSQTEIFICLCFFVIPLRVNSRIIISTVYLLLTLFLKGFFKKRFYLFIFREEKGGKEGNINVWLHLECPQRGTWPATQACALIGNQTGDPLVPRPALNPLRHTSQG